jgi:hypothetical protein
MPDATAYVEHRSHIFEVPTLSQHLDEVVVPPVIPGIAEILG